MFFLKKNTLIIFFIFITNYSHANDKFSFVDIEFLFENSNLGISITKELEKINNNDIKNFQSQEKNLISKENEIKKIQNIISKDELEIKVSELKKEFENYKKYKEETIIKFNNKKKTELSIFFEKINPILLEYMTKNSIGILFEKKNIFIGNSEYDITNNILKIINEKF